MALPNAAGWRCRGYRCWRNGEHEPGTAYAERSRQGLRLGDGKVVDLLLHDGLHCAFDQMHMGDYANQIAAAYGVTRQAQDEWALRSQQRAVESIRKGIFKEEIIAAPIMTKAGLSLDIDTDEAPRADTDAVKLASLRPAFKGAGTITAGNAPGLNDGAAALVVTTMERAVQSNQIPQASVLAHAAVSVEARDYPITPALVIQKLLQQSGATMQNIDLFEINEAFAVVVLASGIIAGWKDEKVNVHGGLSRWVIQSGPAELELTYLESMDLSAAAVALVLQRFAAAGDKEMLC